jgi:uroporphyrinogen decarboxylase
MPGMLCGHEKAWMNMATNPVLAEALLDRFLELKLTYYQAAIERLLVAGVEYFIIGESDDLGGQKGPLISPEMYRRMVKPRHAQLFKAIKEYSRGRAFVELHTDGAITKLLPDLIETGIDILNPIQVSAAGMADTRALKRVFGDAIVFHGGGVDSQYTLPHGTPQEVKDEVRRRMDDLAPGGGFIFTPVHSIQHDVPFENFMAMLETYREYA